MAKINPTQRYQKQQPNPYLGPPRESKQAQGMGPGPRGYEELNWSQEDIIRYMDYMQQAGHTVLVEDPFGPSRKTLNKINKLIKYAKKHTDKDKAPHDAEYQSGNRAAQHDGP